MKLWIKIVSLILPLALLLSLTGCKQTDAERQGFFPELQYGETQMEWTQNPSQVPITPLADLETPIAILYYRNGNVTAFTPEDEAFEQILALNAARDNLNRNDSKSWSQLLSKLSEWDDGDWARQGAYLLYRYPTDSYGDLLFRLCTNDKEIEIYANWMAEFSGGYAVIAELLPADELIAFLDKAA